MGLIPCMIVCETSKCMRHCLRQRPVSWFRWRQRRAAAGAKPGDEDESGERPSEPMRACRGRTEPRGRQLLPANGTPEGGEKACTCRKMLVLARSPVCHHVSRHWGGEHTEGRRGGGLGWLLCSRSGRTCCSKWSTTRAGATKLGCALAVRAAVL